MFTQLCAVVMYNRWMTALVPAGKLAILSFSFRSSSVNFCADCEYDEISEGKKDELL